MWPASPAERFVPLLLALAVLAAYANALPASFQFDDWNVIVGDPRVQSIGAWWDAMPGIRPLLKLSYAVNHASGLGPLGFHAANVAIHLANVLLVFGLLRRWPARDATLAATVAALLFALHPAQTEAVTYASGRSVSLSALFALASLYAWVAGRERQSAWLSAGLSPLLFALALGTRETVAVLPLALLLWQATAGAGRAAAGWRATAPHWAVLGLAAGAALALPAYQQFFAASLAARPPAAQALTQVNALGYLAGQLVRVDRLNADPMLPVIGALTPLLALKAAALAGVAGLAVISLRRRPPVAFGVLWFLLWLLPTNSLLPRFDVANDRQLYLALIGPAWLCGLAAAALWRRRRAPAVALMVVLTGVLAMATVSRNGTYADETRFWADVTAKTPGNARAWSNLGYAHALAGRRDEAERAFLRALQLDPGNSRAAVNLALLRRGAL